MQIKNSFDQESVIKILKGMGIAAGGAAALAALNFIGTLEINNPMLASFVAWGIPVAINIVKEWKKGQEN